MFYSFNFFLIYKIFLDFFLINPKINFSNEMDDDTCKEIAELIFYNKIEEIKNVLEKNKEILSKKVLYY
jgi:hypothetical protein